MQKIKINFTDFWPGFADNNFLLKTLKEHFPVEISDNPDFLIYSVYSNKHLNFRCKKIFYTAENILPDYRFCDYSIGFNYDEENSRHLRYPLYLFYGDINDLVKTRTFSKDELEYKNKFCCFVVSNDKPTERSTFFKKLNDVKHVDSAGRAMNNMEGGWCIPEGEKYNFLRSYQFNIAFENAASAGYTTEKIFEPMHSLTLPIYWGDPMIGNDFNTKSFIHVRDFKNEQFVVDCILEMQANRDLYVNKINEPFLHNNTVPNHLKVECLLTFFENIFNNIALTPVSKTTRFVVNSKYYESKKIINGLSAKFRKILK